ncbi:MAG TPA: hypothetical protein DCE56_30330, partial [Cyanobacteria bacterium UBA8553]|nr:hypothetical protein [Cyanobacteria bacterium UBA8553]HAJ61866.1 hypothetical protein [Cyanobacteria bacterium UBA8543]
FYEALVGVKVAAVAAVTVLNSFKWRILGALGNRPFGMYDAIIRGDIDTVRNYMHQGGNPFTYDGEVPEEAISMTSKNSQSKNSVFYWYVQVQASSFRFARCSSYLMSPPGPDINITFVPPMTLVECARAAQKENIAELMLTQIADVNATDNQGNTPLHIAVTQGSFERAKTMFWRKDVTNSDFFMYLAKFVDFAKQSLSKYVVIGLGLL